MNTILFEISVVLILIILNGFFSGAEMAIISLRKTRIKQLTKEGNKRAKLAEKVLQNPENFLATVQVGITLVSTIASAFAGSKIAVAISPKLARSSLPFISENAETISFVIIVLAITYLSIVIGELIPKSLGIKFSERFSLLIVYPFHILSKIFFPLTRFLTLSSNLVLKIFGDRTNFSEANLTEEELRTILYESHKAGTIKKYEHELLDNVFDFSDIAVSQIMTPRSQLFAVDLSEPFDKNLQSIISSGYTRIPVYKDKIDNILGILNVKSLLTWLAGNRHPDSFEQLLQKPKFFPNTQRINDLLKRMQKEKVHFAIVTDEHGDVDGIVTIEDILEEIVGEIKDEGDEEKNLITKLKDGSYEVDGSVSIVDFNRYFKTALPEDAPYTTISGLLLDKLEKIPDTNARTTIENIEFTIKEKTERVIKMVIVRVPAPDANQGL